MAYVNPALETIKKVGVFGLCHTDGCACLSFSVHGVDVEVSCRKSSGSRIDGGTTIRVNSPSLDFYYEDDHGKAIFTEIGEEVARQMAEGLGYGREGFLILTGDSDEQREGTEK